MRTICCAETRKNRFLKMWVIVALVLLSLPATAADRITRDMLKRGITPQILRGRLDRFPGKSIHRLSTVNQAGLNTTAAAVHAAVRSPVFSFSQPSSRSGSVNYGFMVGSSPFTRDVHGSSVPAFVVPVVMVVHQVAKEFGFDANNNLILTGITDEDATFDPTQAAPACLGSSNNVPFQLAVESPLYQNHHWVWGGTDLGNTQYGDAFQRANFWRKLGEDGRQYHLRFDPIVVLPPVVFDFPKGSGIALPQSSSVLKYSACAPTVLVDFNLFDEQLDYIVLPQLAASSVDASTFPMFIAGNVLWGAVIGELPFFIPEAAGYHSFSNVDPAQTYGVAQFGDENIFTWPDAMPLSHEIGEWMNDPTGSNYVQYYTVSFPGSPPYCQGNYEVGDILTGTYMPLITGKNGYAYTLQEMAFFSFFYGGPSIGVNGWYSNNDTLKQDGGAVCSTL